MDNKAFTITTPVAVLICLMVVGAGAGSYVVYEDVKSANIDPFDKLIDNNVVIDKIEFDAGVVEAILLYFGLEFIIEDSTKYSQFVECLENIDAKVYMITGTNASTIVSEYEDLMDADGYTYNTDGWSGEFWASFIIYADGMFHARVIMVASGTLVSTLFGCDVVLFTSHGFLFQYESCDFSQSVQA